MATFAQSGVSAERSAMRNIDKHRWRKAEEHLRKSLDKDSVNAATRYVLAVLYFHSQNPAFDLDSACHYAVGALGDYTHDPISASARLMRIARDSVDLRSLKASIDSTAFAAARQVNTEAAYQVFISHFPSAEQHALAVELRDELAFQQAVRENSLTSLRTFLRRYPHALRAAEARTRYDRLLFLTETKDGRLVSYTKFLKDHPETPYRIEIDRHIFDIATADGSPGSFTAFIKKYPANTFASNARRTRFYLLAAADNPVWPPGILNDSLQHLIQVNTTYLVPFLQNGRFGFIDKDGHEVIAPRFQNIPDRYLCGYITDDILHADNELVTRTGSRVYQGAVRAFTDLGIGFLKVETATGVKVIHKGGFTVMDSIEDARLLANSYIAVERKGTWRITTLTGRLLGDEVWDDVSAFGEVLVFSRNDKKYIATRRALSQCAEGIPLKLSEPLDEVRLWPDGRIWGRSGNFQGVLDQSLHRVIGFDQQVLTRTFFGATATFSHGFTLYNTEGRRSSTFEAVHIVGKRVVVRKNGAWFPFNVRDHGITGNGYDSLVVQGPFMMGHRGDSVDIHFEGERRISFFRPYAVSFIPGMDSVSFLMVEERRDAKSVFNLEGKKLFTASFDAIEYAGEGIFVVTTKGRKGLRSMTGEKLLSAEFDAVGSAKDQRLSLLKDQRFGAYSIAHKKCIRPQYDRNLIPYNENILTTFKNGYYGFLGWNNKPLSAFEFDEIRYWDDSVALVKVGSQWNLYNIFSAKREAGDMRKITVISNSDTEKIAIVQRGNLYGVMSNRRKEVVPVAFSHIINLGSAEEPLYFTETHVREASLFIVIYYDRRGNFLRKEIYDDATDYDRIYCSDN